MIAGGELSQGTHVNVSSSRIPVDTGGNERSFQSKGETRAFSELRNMREEMQCVGGCLLHCVHMRAHTDGTL